MTNSSPQNPRHQLLDVQQLCDDRGVALNIAGIRDIEMPMGLLQKDGKIQQVQARMNMGVALPEDTKGTHMSRFVIQLTEWSRNNVMSLKFRNLLAETLDRLKASEAVLDMAFTYFMEKKAPVTDYSAPMGYRCSFQCKLTRGENNEEQYQLLLGLSLPIATLCPCSKEISDYGAHNQRAELRVQLVMDTETEHPMVWIEDLAQALETCASCPVYPILKRTDEKWVTERQYENPKFVEDVARDATVLLRDYAGVKGFAIEIEALESIHGHNAWAYHQENFTVDHLRPRFA